MFWPVNKDDFDLYIESCNDFLNDNTTFENFKRDRRFRLVMEHTTHEEIEDFYAKKIKHFPEITKDVIESFRKNDLYNNPNLSYFTEYGIFSPSTFRYMKQTIDIYSLVKDVNISTIFEVGGGYGGLCKTIECLITFNIYYSADMDIVNKLSQKYLMQFPEVLEKVIYVDCEKLYNFNDIDLFISNYAFSELSFESQLEYYEKVIMNSKYFYITYNHGWHDNQTDINYKLFINLALKKFDIIVEQDQRSNKVLYGTSR